MYLKGNSGVFPTSAYLTHLLGQNFQKTLHSQMKTGIVFGKLGLLGKISGVKVIYLRLLDLTSAVALYILFKVNDS